jgi:hypothetical protein
MNAVTLLVEDIDRTIDGALSEGFLAALHHADDEARDQLAIIAAVFVNFLVINALSAGHGR